MNGWRVVLKLFCSSSPRFTASPRSAFSATQPVSEWMYRNV